MLYLPYFLFLVLLQTLCLTVSGDRLTSRLREWSFRSLLRHDMTWFDEPHNTPGELSTRLEIDASLVHGVSIQCLSQRLCILYYTPYWGILLLQSSQNAFCAHVHV